MAAPSKPSESAGVMNTRRMSRDESRSVVFEVSRGSFRISIELIGESLWVVSTWSNGDRALLRAAHAPGGGLVVEHVDIEESQVSLTLDAGCGGFDVVVELFDDEEPLIRAQTRLTPAANMTLTNWPRDLLMLGSPRTTRPATGSVTIAPSGLSASLLQLEVGEHGSLFYFQNLTSLADYANTTEVSLSGTVGGEWPELGFQLPDSEPGRFLAAGESVVISDAFVRLSTQPAGDHLALARQFLDNLGSVYVHLPRPDTTYRDWWATASAVIDDLQNCVGCWSFAAGKKYVNAYLSDYTAPPELMVQLAVLMPLLDYAGVSGTEPSSIEPIRSTLESFFDPELETVRRWLPARDDDLDGAEEQKKPEVMDSWYLHHTLLNLGRLAAQDDDAARGLFLASMSYVIKAARLFEYDWPIFFDIATLEIIKAESEPGAGGQKDVPGIYAHVMLQAWDLTGEQRYLDEANRAGRALSNRGFEIFYQANITAFGALAMFRLWKITGTKRFLDSCYLCLANLFANMWLWDCGYGHGRNYKTFLAAIPVKDAPYVASYEEQEVCATFATLLSESADDDMPPSVTLLVSEYVRHLADRAWYSYPSNVPADLLPDRPKTGELSRELWIPLEDMSDGWEKSGAVGQEVYGAGLALGVVVRHYHPIDDGAWILYAESLIAGPEMTSTSALSFTVLGDPRVTSRMRALGRGRPTHLVGTTELDGQSEQLTAKKSVKGYSEYAVRGGQVVTFEW